MHLSIRARVFLPIIAFVGAVFAFDANAQSPWKAVESGDVVHFFHFDGSNKIARYDLASGTWLSTLVPVPPIGSSMTAGWVDDDGLYLGFGKTLRRYTRAGTGQTHLRNTAFPILDIISDDEYLIVSSGENYDDYFSSIRKSDNTVVADNEVGFYRGVGLSIDPVGRVIFGRTTGISPSDILRLPYQANGTFGRWTDSPHHGDYPSATQTFSFPGGQRVVDSSGTIYQASNLDYVGSLAGAFDDLKFLNGSSPIILRGNILTAYSAAFLETGFKTLSKTCHTIALRPNQVISFYPEPLSPSGISTISTALSELNPGTGGPGVDPVGALYTPDSVFMGNDGMVHLFSKKFQSIFRWNPLTASYGTTIPLVKIPVHVTYNSTLNRIYTGTANGEIRVIDLEAGSTSDVPFFNLASGVQGLASAGEFLFAEDASGAWESQYVISSTGVLLSSDEWRNHSNVYEWSPANSAMYQFRDGTSPNDLIRTPISSQGILGTEIDSPYHGGVGTQAPIRVSPGGEIVILGSGEVFDGNTLQRKLDNLPTAFVDGNWRSDGSFVTIRNYNSQVLVERYSANFGVIDSATFPGTSHRIVPLASARILVISIENSIPRFRLLDANLDLINGPIDLNPPGAPQNPNATNLTSGSVTINWTDADNRETGFVVERKGTDSQATWSAVGTVASNVTSLTDSGLSPSTGYYYRISAFNDDGSSPYSNELFVSTPAAAPPAPSSLSKTGSTATSVTLAWSTVAGATGYKIERLVAPSTWSTIQTVGSGTSSSTISGLSSGTSHTFRVRAFNSGGNSPPSPELVATTDPGPVTPPTGIAASDGVFEDRIAVAWTPVAGALSYEVFRNSAATGAGAVSLGTVTAPSFEDLSPEVGVIYFYAVTVTTANGTSGLSTWNSGNTVLPKPGAPEILVASTGSHVDRVVLSWNAGNHATSYNVYRSASPGSFGNFLGSTSATSFSDNLALPGQNYYYRVTSRNSSGFSDEAAGPVLGFARLGQVTGLRVSYHRSDGVHLSWEGVVGANAYSVLRNSINDPEGATLITITSDLEFMDSSAAVDENYYYFVRAENGSIHGSPTDGEEGVRLAAPGYLADLLSGDRPESLIGDNHYGTLRSTRISRKARPVSWISRIQNDGLLTDDLTFSGQKGDRNFKISYFGSTGNVTADVVTSGFRLDDLGPGDSGEIRTNVSPSAKLRGKRARKVISGGVSSLGDPTSKDDSVTFLQVK